MAIQKRFVAVFIIIAIGLTGASYLAAQNMMEPAITNVAFKGPGGVTLKGYLAKPAGNGPFPGVVMIHEWWGLNKDTAALADALAKRGFVVLAADAFRGSVAQNAGDARTQVSNTPREQIAADLDAAFAYLKTQPYVKPNRIASAGFCFGGTQSMYMGTRNSDLAAVVIFYGSGPITDAANLGTMKEAGPVLGIYGENDGGIPVDQVRAFEKALNDKNVRNSITVYPGVGHAFVKSDTYMNGGPAQKAWEQMVDFLKKEIEVQ